MKKIIEHIILITISGVLGIVFHSIFDNQKYIITNQENIKTDILEIKSDIKSIKVDLENGFYIVNE